MIRFGWDRVSKEDACRELKRRDLQITLQKDSKSLCMGCGIAPKRDEQVYKASVSHSTNQVERLAHKRCVERVTGQSAAVAAHGVTIAEQQKRKLETRVPNASDLPPSTVDDVLRDMERFFTEFHSQKSVDYERGFRDGALQTWTKIKELMTEGRR